MQKYKNSCSLQRENHLSLLKSIIFNSYLSAFIILCLNVLDREFTMVNDRFPDKRNEVINFI